MKRADPPFRIALVDDHPVMLDGYRNMLAGEMDFAVCATASNAAEAMSMAERTEPDLVITDITLPGRSGLDLIKDLTAWQPDLRILVISMHDEALWAERCLKAGAKGYVMKESDRATMLAAIRQVLDGGIYLSPRLAARVISAFASARPRGSETSPLEKLSDREFEVFRLFGEGQTAKEIAARLNLSPKTVAVHRDHIKEKMGYQTSAEMIREAVRWVQVNG
ncbi:MAG: DNA-binding response regulator [Verrucomicrobia bacterium]|nr:MAG: DNA-binding response regulator [Verrucomicrobiota bacterium]